MTQGVPEGVLTIAELSGQNAEVLWAGLKPVLVTSQLVDQFNTAIKEAVENGIQARKDGMALAMEAMSVAGDVILGANRPSNIVEAVIRSAGPLIQEVPTPAPKPPRRIVLI